MRDLSYRNLMVWQRAMELVEEIYLITKQFPADEKFGLTSQMRRAVVSIPSNIAEGKLKGTVKEYRRFLLHAFGSGAELETQIEIVARLRYATPEDLKTSFMLLDQVMRMLNTLIRRLES
ncbi:hypothetical protein CO174_02975 [Candidatus Uhrbacteria bacterium CG_4_9_14_3_um_filter_50_9]|uniref:Four helix bundle protein n=1 Tax=Candidatus Uhrbacteria bacterium CG_4_9_14_3_um_filter_50_9 TaxID=1975035 RepID=A0A2M7XC69_9BACT|nr:MAG: hypothetical protein CO174_02975 [Candidatus Uhrbacteria bacterium CG_4_9_14_3_um_filter_50_9]